MFDNVQAPHKNRTRRMPDQELLRRLKKLCLRKGKLTTAIVENARGVRSKAECVRRFGSMLKVYELIGYKPSRVAVRVSNHFGRSRKRREGLIRTLTDMFPQQVEAFRMPYNRWEAVRLDDGTLVRLVFGHRYETSKGCERWKLIPFLCRRKHITLLCLLKDDGETAQTFVVMPEIEFTKEYQIKGLIDPWLRNGAILPSLEGFYEQVQAMKERKLESTWQLEFPPTKRGLPKP